MVENIKQKNIWQKGYRRNHIGTYLSPIGNQIEIRNKNQGQISDSIKTKIETKVKNP